MRFLSKLVWLLIVSLALQSGCGGGNPRQISEPEQLESSPGLVGLMSPEEALRELSFIGEERFINGSQFSMELPNSRVTPQVLSGSFSPDYLPPTKINLADAAYAIYAFSLPDYSGDPLVEIRWDTPETDLSKLYYGIGNFSLKRWDWVVAPADGLVSLDSLADHQSPTGKILVTVILMGEDPGTLAWLRVGGNVGPDAAISADSLIGDIPFYVEFDASGSKDHDGNIVSYEWDLDGDGTYELGPAPEPTESRTYLSPGSYDVSVGVTDDLGESDTTIVTINANVPGNIAPIASVTADPTSGPASLLVNFDASLSDDPDGTIDFFEWDWNNDGVFDESSPANPLASHTFSEEGVFEVVLRVKDNQGITDTASVSITVEPGGTENETPVALLTANPLNQTAPFEANFDASASFDPDGAIVKYEYDWESTGAFVELPAITQHTYNLPGNHDCTLRVTDNVGSVDTYTLRLTGNAGNYSEYEDNDDVASANAVPNINFSGFTGNAGGPIGYNGGKDDWYQLHLEENYSYTIFMSGFLNTEADLDMRLYEKDGTTVVKSATGVSDEEEIIWICDLSGEYYLKCYSYDDNVSNYTLEITATLVVPPVASFTAIPTNGDRRLEVAFDASTSTDPAGGGITKYDWDFNGNGEIDLTKTDSSDDPPLATGFYIERGTFNATLTVTNVLGATDTTSIEITVTGDDDNEVEPNNDQNEDDTNQDAFLANNLPAFPFSGWFGTVGPKPITDGPFGDPDDWYKFTVNSSGEVDIFMNLIDTDCDIDMKLFAEGEYTDEIGRSGGTDDDEQITMTIDPGTYYLQVYAFTGAPATGVYHIQASFTP